jgi:hypothetical protein
MSDQTPSGPAVEHEKSKTFWERITTSTPVVLTVVATLLAGLSSSEMTRAQYYRALAAQNQSKVSDEWNFFQAKRIRGTGMEGTIMLLRSTTGAASVSAESLRASALRLSDDLERAGREGDALVKAAEAAGPAAEGMRTAAERFRNAAQAALASRGKLAEALAANTIQQPLLYLTAGTLPERVEHSAGQRKELDNALGAIDPEVRKSLSYIDPDLLKSLNDLNPQIPRAMAEVNARKTERQMADTLARISEEQVHKAIDDAEADAREFEDVGKPTGKVFRMLDETIAEQAGLARSLLRASQEVGTAAAALPDEARLGAVRQSAAAVGRTAQALKTAADELASDFKAAQLGYDARRYDREARYNQAVAGLYELDVRKASLQSERHRQRSMQFFYAMLAAQAGVTIATLSLAVRYRSVLWAVASVAGVAALAIAAYVYLIM